MNSFVEQGGYKDVVDDNRRFHLWPLVIERNRDVALVDRKAGNHDRLSFHTYKKFSSLAVATLRSLL
jgi:hypothetical protein